MTLSRPSVSLTLIFILATAFLSSLATSSIRGFSQVASLTFNSGDLGGILPEAVIDTIHGYAYFALFNNPVTVVKVSLSDFTRVSSLTFNSGENGVGFAYGGGSPAVIDPVGGFAYFTSYGPAGAGQIVKIRLSNFTEVSTISLAAGEGAIACGVIDTGGGYAYFATNRAPGLIIKVRLSDFTRVGTLFLNAGEDLPRACVIDTNADFAYFGTSTSPQGKIVKVSLSSFTEVGTALTLKTARVSGGVIDPAAHFAYFASWTSPGNITRINLNTFTEAGNLTLQGGYLSPAAIDTYGGFAYFGDSLSSVLDKIRLSDFTRVASLTPNPSSIAAELLDPTSGYLYLGVGGSPGSVVKIQVAASPSIPQALSATPGLKKISLAWSPPNSNGDRSIQGYKIYKSPSPGGEASGNYSVATIGNLTSYIDTDITAGVPYYYKISAYNNFGESPLSTEASSTASGPAPVLPSATFVALIGIMTVTAVWVLKSHRRSLKSPPSPSSLSVSRLAI